MVIHSGAYAELWAFDSHSPISAAYQTRGYLASQIVML